MTNQSYFNIPGFRAISGFACISTAVLSAIAIMCLHKRENDIRSEPYYKQMMKIWERSETAKFLIGEPIKLKHVEIFNHQNSIGKDRADFFVPIEGKNYDGKMNISATCVDDEWALNEISLELNKDLKDKKLILFRDKKDQKVEIEKIKSNL